MKARGMSWTMFVLTPQVTVLGYLYLAVCMLLFMAKDVSHVGGGVFLAQWRPWVSKRWRFSTTLGNVVVMHPDHGHVVRQHELIHVRQFQDVAFMGWIAGLLLLFVNGGLLPEAAVVWASAPVWKLAHYVTSMLRGNGTLHSRSARGVWGKFKRWWFGVYREAEHERSAYAQTALYSEGQTWLTRTVNEAMNK